MKLEVEYLFPISSSGANFYIYQDAKDAKESTNQGGNFLDFHGFSCPKSDLHHSQPSHENFINGVADPEIANCKKLNLM